MDYYYLLESHSQIASLVIVVSVVLLLSCGQSTQSQARFPFKRNQPIMVATALTEHSYWLALAFVA